MFSGSAWRVVRFGEPRESLELQEMTWPTPARGHVLVRIAAAGAGAPDRMMFTGRYPLVGEPPFGLGQEAAGEVVAVPDDAKFAVGDKIAGVTAFGEGWGGFATYTYVLENSAIRVPADMTDVDAGGFPIAFRTAHAGLIERAQVEAGQTVLVLGAAGSSGSAAVRLAKALGTTVIAVAGGAEKVKFCDDQGADHVVDHRAQDMAARVAEITDGRGVDVIYDPVGGELATTALASLARDGQLLLVGQASYTGPSIDQAQLMMGNRSVVGVLAAPQDDSEVEAAIWSRLEGMAASGAIGTPVGAVYGFDEVPRMVVEQVSAAPGKRVVRVG